MNYKFNLHMLFLCFFITAVLSAREDVQLTHRYIVKQHLGGERIPVQVEQMQLIYPAGQNIVLLNDQNGPGSNRVGKSQNFVQYQPATSYQIVETPRNVAQNNGGTTLRFPSATTTTYTFSNDQEENVKKDIQDNLLSLIGLLENGGSNQKSTQFTQVNGVQNGTPNRPQMQNQPQTQYQQVQPSQNINQPRFQAKTQNQLPNQPRVNYQPQNSNQQQYQTPAQNQFPQNQAQQNQAPQKQFHNPGAFVHPGNVGSQNQLPNRHATKNSNSQMVPLLTPKIDDPDDDKIGGAAFQSIVFGGNG